MISVLQFVYWSDVQERAIHRVHLNGEGHEVFLNASNGIGAVDGKGRPGLIHIPCAKLHVYLRSEIDEDGPQGHIST